MKTDETGFVLLEALVALAILATTITVLLSNVASNLNRVDGALSGQVGEAEALAALGRVGGQIPAREGEWAGSGRDGWSWRVRISPYAEPGMPKPSGRDALLAVDIDTWHRDRNRQTIVLRTLVRTGVFQ